MALKDSNDETFAKDLPRTGPALVMFKASWCGPCKALAPHLDSIALEFPNMPILRLDEKTSKKTMDEHKIQGYPTLKVVQMLNGKKIGEREITERTPKGIRDTLRKMTGG